MIKQLLSVLVALMCFASLPAFAESRAVSSASYESLAISRTLSYPARVINLQQSSIAAETSGRITEFRLEVGDSVKAGQTLIKIDCQSALINQQRLEAGLKRLNASRELTQQQLERARRLVKSNSISREELDQRQTQLNADEASIEEQRAQLAAAKLDISRCTVAAPFSGIITQKFGQLGSYAAPGVQQLTLLNPNAIEVELSLPSTVLAVLQQAKDARLQVGDQAFPLTLRSALPLVSTASLQQLVRLRFSGEAFPPAGSFGQVIFSTSKHYLPADVIQKREQQFGVFIAHQGKAQFTPIDGVQEGQSVYARFPAETPIITSDLQLLSDQDAVTLKP